MGYPMMPSPRKPICAMSPRTGCNQSRCSIGIRSHIAIGICRRAESSGQTLSFAALSLTLIAQYGGRGGNRTHNPRLRRPVLYPIELLAHVVYFSCVAIAAAGAAHAGESGTTA